MFSSMQTPVPLVPHYMVKSKMAVDANAPPNAQYVSFDKPPSASFRALEEERVVTAFKESVVQAWPGPGRLDSPAPNQPSNGATNADTLATLPPRPFEFPDGYNTVFGVERHKVIEPFFATTAAYTSPEHPAPKPDDSLVSLAYKSIMACDSDVRPHLLNNIVLTGAGSLVDKLPDRLYADLQALFPNPKVRVIASSNTAERRYGAWIGGSVLGSLGTFHQMWVSKQEYEEFGAGDCGEEVQVAFGHFKY